MHAPLQDVPDFGRGITGQAGAAALANALAPAPPKPPTPDACDPYMISLFQSIWNQTMRFADQQREAGNRVDLGPAGFSSLPQNVLGPVVSPGPDVVPRVAIPVTPQTIAIVHGHPGNAVPSQADRNSPYPNFVVSQFAVYVTDPRNPTSAGDRMVRGQDWARPCPQNGQQP